MRRRHRAPLGARLDGGLGDEHEDEARQHDPVRDDAVLDVDRGESDQHRAEEGRHRRLGREPEAKHAGDDQGGRQRLDRRGSAAGMCRLAGAAAAAEQRVREQRDVVPRGDLRVAAHAGRTGRGRSPRRSGTRDATTLRKLPTDEARCRDDRCERDVHARGRRSAQPGAELRHRRSPRGLRRLLIIRPLGLDGLLERDEEVMTVGGGVRSDLAIDVAARTSSISACEKVCIS